MERPRYDSLNVEFFFFLLPLLAIIPFAPGAPRRNPGRASPVGVSPYYRISTAPPSPYFLSLSLSRDFLRRLLFPLALTSFSIKLPTFNRSVVASPFACIYACGRPFVSSLVCERRSETAISPDSKPSLSPPSNRYRDTGTVYQTVADRF